MNKDPEHHDAPGLYRLASAAGRVGMSPEALCVACDAGDIPMTVLRIGPRNFRYVRSSELEEFLRSQER